MRRGPIARFFGRVEILDNDCWRWTGGLTHNGYGQFSIGTRNIRAHRFAYELFIGPVPDGLELDHSCRNRACVNPAHLEAVTSRENTLRGISPSALNARKAECDRGHELAGRNLHIRPDGRRRCRACEADRVRRLRIEKAA